MDSTKGLLSVTTMAVVVALFAGCTMQSDKAASNAQFQAVSSSEVYLPEIQGEEKAILTHAPDVPPPITRSYATKVIVEMETVEVVRELADGVEYTFWTFGGNVPGQFIRVREGDMVQFRLANMPNSTVPHNIDLHAVTGTGGGATVSMVIPGMEATFEFRAIKPGIYVYHCATAPVGVHIANGMYGLILVEPKDGMPEVDREYYIMQSEFYTSGEYNQKGLQDFDMDKAIDEDADYVVFNGRVGSLVGENSLKATVGETVRLFVGNGGPNLTSSFHVIGEMFDRVYGEGGSLINQLNVQTTVVPPGGATIVEFGVDVPGHYILVDHAIFRAFNKGAAGYLDVAGEENPNIFAGQTNMTDYTGSESSQ